jgi:hypothetical protein
MSFFISYSLSVSYDNSDLNCFFVIKIDRALLTFFSSHQHVPEKKRVFCIIVLLSFLYLKQKSFDLHKIEMSVVKVGSLFLFILIIQCKYSSISTFK